MDPSPDANFIFKHLAEIIVGLIVALLAVLKLLGRKYREKTEASPPEVTRADLLSTQLEITKTISREFSSLRKELEQQLRTEMREVHKRIDAVISSSKKD